MSSDPIRAALERLVEALNDYDPKWDAFPEDALTAALAALDAAPTDGPSLEEVEDLCEEHCFNVEGYESVECLQGPLNDAISRWGSPATQPAPDAGEVESFKTLLTVGGESSLGFKLFPEQCRRLAALLEQLSATQSPVAVAVDGWQPIDTAPVDGTEILASDYDAIDIVSYGEWGRGVFGWTNRELEAMFPAWWQPLPDHPPLPTTTPAGQEGA